MKMLKSFTFFSNSNDILTRKIISLIYLIFQINTSRKEWTGIHSNLWPIEHTLIVSLLLLIASSKRQFRNKKVRLTFQNYRIYFRFILLPPSCQQPRVNNSSRVAFIASCIAHLRNCGLYVEGVCWRVSKFQK